MTLFPYENEVEPEAVSINKNKLKKVINRFKKQQLAGAFPGGQIVLRRYRKVVLNETCGISRGLRKKEQTAQIKVQPHTPFPVFSAGKPLAAVAIALLEDRGLIDIEAPVAEYFPEFSRHGKENITTLDVLTHRAGILLPSLVKNYQLWGNREFVLNHILESKPKYKRGTFAYMPYEYGWILSEIVLKVDGRTLPNFVADEIVAPLGLPALQYGLAGRDLNSLSFSYWLGKNKVMVAGINVAEKFEDVHNSENFFNAMNPADSMVTDAASLAAFYEFLINKAITNSGKQLISEKIIQNYTAKKIFGWDRSLRTFLNVGKGFILGAIYPSPFGWWNTGKCFGHSGGFSSLAFGDYEKNIAVSIITNGNRDLIDFANRFISLAHGLRKACR